MCTNIVPQARILPRVYLVTGASIDLKYSLVNSSHLVIRNSIIDGSNVTVVVNTGCRISMVRIGKAALNRVVSVKALSFV